MSARRAGLRRLAPAWLHGGRGFVAGALFVALLWVLA